MIDLKLARELLRRAVEQQGESFCYSPRGDNRCYYEPLTSAIDGDPRRDSGCIVGTALTNHGETRHLEFNGIVSSLVDFYPDMMDRAATHYFAVAQRRQDRGEAWGVALKAAEEWAEEYYPAPGVTA